MKQTLRFGIGYGVILAALFLFVSTYAIGGDEPVSGKKLFDAKCAQCHGKDAKGNPKMAKLLKVEPTALDLTKAEAVSMTSDAVVTQITNGKKKMPGYKGKMTDDQIQAVATYLKGIQKKKEE